MLPVLVREFESFRGETLNLLAKIKEDAKKKYGMHRSGEEGEEPDICVTPDLSYDKEGERKKRRAKILKGMGKRSFSVVRIRGYSLLLVGHTLFLDGIVGEVLFRLYCTLPRVVPHYCYVIDIR